MIFSTIKVTKWNTLHIHEIQNYCFMLICNNIHTHTHTHPYPYAPIRKLILKIRTPKNEKKHNLNV